MSLILMLEEEAENGHILWAIPIVFFFIFVFSIQFTVFNIKFANGQEEAGDFPFLRNLI